MEIQSSKPKIQKLLRLFIFLFSFLFLSANSHRLLFAAVPTVTPKQIQEKAYLEENVSPQEKINQATPATEIEEKTRQIQQIREAIKEKVRERIQEIKERTPRAFVGEITQITDSLLTLTTPRKTIKVEINTETKIIGLKRKELEPKDLKVGDFCIAIGYLGEDDTLLGKRIVIIPKSKPPVREIAFGHVTDISTEEKILTVKNEKKGIIYTIAVTDKTIITKKVEKKIERVKFSAIEIGDRIVAVGTPGENEKKLITAKIIHVIPGKALGQQKPTPSISPPLPVEE